MTTTLYPTQQRRPTRALTSRARATKARAQVNALRLAFYRDPDMHYVRIIDAKTKAVVARIELVFETPDGEEHEYAREFDIELARRIVNAVNKECK